MIKSIIKSLFNQFGLEIHKGKRKDPFEDQEMLINSNETSVIFDVGAHTGTITVKYKKLFPKATIYCFEPTPDSFKILQQKALALDKVKTFQCAICDRIGKSKFHVNFYSSCNSLLPRPSKGKCYYDEKASNIDTIEVNITTIDDFCNEHSISKINILKLDVEGAELLVMKGALNKLNQKLIDLIYTEVMFVSHYENGVLFHELCNFLSNWGYSLFNIYDLKRAENGQLRWGNAIFVSPNVRSNIIEVL